jgi:hypothetical protein
MKRLIRLCFLTLILSAFVLPDIYAAPVLLSGTIASDSVRVLLKEQEYAINNDLLIKGTLIIEPGTTIYFYDNGRIVVGTGGRLLADGFAYLTKKVRPTN